MTNEAVAQVVSNDPVTSGVEVKLGDRTFKLVDLAYDDYVTFNAFLEPFLKAFAGSMLGRDSGSFSALTASDLVRYCSDSLPQMVQICLRQTEPRITVQEIKTLGRTPFKLVPIVLKQVERNGIIQEITDFFELMLPIMGLVTEAKTVAASMTEVTP